MTKWWRKKYHVIYISLPSNNHIVAKKVLKYKLSIINSWVLTHKKTALYAQLRKYSEKYQIDINIIYEQLGSSKVMVYVYQHSGKFNLNLWFVCYFISLQAVNFIIFLFIRLTLNIAIKIIGKRKTNSKEINRQEAHFQM